MNKLQFTNDAVCYAYNKQWFVRDNEYNDLTNKEGNAFANSSNVITRKDFQLNEITTGDFIPASELDTEQKYNEVVEVFGLFGFEPCKSHSKYIGMVNYWNGVEIYDGEVVNTNATDGRQLTHSQIIAIGKLKRMMLGRENAAPKADAGKPKSAVDYLNECVEVQKQRGEQYDSTGTGERSFDAAAKAYNALTGGNLKGSDVCLILTCVKAVRQYSNPERLHEDSLLDLVSYASLWAEELNKELK